MIGRHARSLGSQLYRMLTVASTVWLVVLGVYLVPNQLVLQSKLRTKLELTDEVMRLQREGLGLRCSWFALLQFHPRDPEFERERSLLEGRIAGNERRLETLQCKLPDVGVFGLAPFATRENCDAEPKGLDSL